MLFADRRDAGARLAASLRTCERGSGIVLGLPRGGVITAATAAARLSLPLGTLVVQKLGAPSNPEYAIGAVAEGGGLSLNWEAVAAYRISRRYVRKATERAQQEIARRVSLYRGGELLPGLAGRAVILVDDGVATGYTMFAAIRSLRAARVGALVVAVPVGPPETVSHLQRHADRVICLASPDPFLAVGRFYRDFAQVTDAAVVAALCTPREG